MPDPSIVPDASANRMHLLDITGNGDDVSSDTVEQHSDVTGGEDMNGAVEDGVTSEDGYSSSGK